MGERINIGTLNNQNIIIPDSENIKAKSDLIKSNIIEMNNSITNSDVNISSTKSNINIVNTKISNIKTVTDDIETTTTDDKTVVDNINTNISGIKTSVKDIDNKITSSKTLLNSTKTNMTHINSEATALSTTTHDLRLNAGIINENIATEENQDKIINILINNKKTKRYGIKIRKNEPDPYTRIEYTYDAEGMKPANMNFNTGIFDYGDWSNIWFIKDNYPCMLKYDGTVDYKLNPNDYSKKEDGTASDYNNEQYNGNVMSRFPLIWTQFREDDDYEYITVSETQYDESYLPIAFENDSGSVKSEMFISAFKGFKSQYNDTLKSIAKNDLYITDYFNYTANDEFTYATNNGPGWCTRTWAQRTLINALLTIISKSDNTQESFGNGFCDTDYRYSYYGRYYSPGRLCQTDQFYGYNDTDTPMKVFHIEDWWGYLNDRIAGLIQYEPNTFYYKMHGPYPVPATVDINRYISEGYKKIFAENLDPQAAESFIKQSTLGPWGRLPGIVSGASSSTYQCDAYYSRLNNMIKYPLVGGFGYNSFGCGAHTLAIDQHPDIKYSNSSIYMSSGLSYIDPTP